MAIQQTNKFMVNTEDKDVLLEANRMLISLSEEADGVKVEGHSELKQAIYHLDLFLSTVGVDDALSPIHELDRILDTHDRYDDGYDDGKTDGYDEGYDDGYSAGQAYCENDDDA